MRVLLRAAHPQLLLGLSPGLDFETRLVAKRNITTVLRAELSRASLPAHGHRHRHRD